MKVVVNNNEEVYPSLESLDELNISYKIKDDGRVVIKFDSDKTKVIKNNDVSAMISSNPESADKSLLYFLIKNQRIIASGNLQKIDDNKYLCDGPFRVFSRKDVYTYQYIQASQIDISELECLNQEMINSTSKDSVRK